MSKRATPKRAHSIVIGMRLSQEIIQEIDERARGESRTRNGMIRAILERYIRGESCNRPAKPTTR